MLLIGLSGLADGAVGLAMRPVLVPYAPVRSQVYFILRVAQGVSVLAACAYFLASRSQWHDYALPAYAPSAVAGLVLTPLLLTSRLVPRRLSILSIAGYALLLAGVVGNPLGIAEIGWHVSPAGTVFLAPGGLFELLFPLLLIVRGFSAGSRACLVPFGRAVPDTGTSRPPRENPGAAPRALAGQLVATSQCLVTVAAYTKGAPPMTENFPGPMAGKTALVTGDTGGIGRATAPAWPRWAPASASPAGRGRPEPRGWLRGELSATGWPPAGCPWRLAGCPGAPCHGGSTYEIAHGAQSGGQQLAARTWADLGGR